MQKVPLKDKDTDNISIDRNDLTTQVEPFYIYRGVGKCVSKAVSLLTDRFLTFMKYTLPITLPLAILMAVVTYLCCDAYAMVKVMGTLPIDTMLWIVGIGTLTMTGFIVYMGMIGRMLKLRSQGVMFDQVKMSALYKSIAQPTMWSLLWCVGYVLIVAAVCGMIYLGMMIDTEEYIELELAKYALYAFAVLAFVLIGMMYMLVLPAVVLSEAKGTRRIGEGLRLGWKKFGKAFAMYLLLFVIAGLLLIILTMPAIVIGLAQSSATLGVLVGDTVDIPDSFPVMSVLMLFVSSFLAVLSVWLIYVPYYYLYASAKVDVEQEDNELL